MGYPLQRQSQEVWSLSRNTPLWSSDELLGSYKESTKISAVPGAVCLLTFGVLRRIDVPSFLFIFVFESSRSLAEELPCPNFVPSTTTCDVTRRS